MAITKSELTELKADIKQKIAALESQIKEISLQTETVTLDQQSTGRVTRIDALAQQQMALANRRAYKNELNGLKRALAAIATEDYGYCEACGDAIGYKRLKIRPETLFCVNCQSATEKS